MTATAPELDLARQTLGHLIELSGLSRRQVEERLHAQGSGTDLSRLLSGRLRLSLGHILAIARVLELHPLEFFRIVFKPPPERSPLLRKLEAIVAPTRTPPRAAPGIAPSTERQLEDLCQRLADLTRQVEDLNRLLRPAEPSALDEFRVSVRGVHKR